MSAESDGVRVTFEPGIDPELYDTGGSRAACLLYKPDSTVVGRDRSGLLAVLRERQDGRRSGRLRR